MDEALTWMETQSAKAFEDVCKVNENADLLPELLKVLLEHLRIVGLDLTRKLHHHDLITLESSAVNNEALKWVEAQTAKAWEEACKFNEKPAVLPELFKVLPDHLCIVGLHITSDDSHRNRTGSSVSTIKAHVEDGGDLYSVSSRGERMQEEAMHERFRNEDTHTSQKEMNQKSKTAESADKPAPTSMLEGSNQLTPLNRESKTAESADKPASTPMFEGSNQPTPSVQESKGLAAFHGSSHVPSPKVLTRPTSSVQESKGLAAVHGSSHVPSSKVLTRPTSPVQESKGLAAVHGSSHVPSSKVLTRPTSPVQESKGLVPADVSSESSKAAIVSDAISLSEVSKQPPAQLDSGWLRWQQFKPSLKPQPEDKNAPNVSKRSTSKPVYHNTQVSTSDRTPSKQTKPIRRDITEEDIAIATFPAELYQEFAMMCPRSMTARNCYHGSSCTLMQCYRKGKEGGPNMHPWIMASCGFYMRGVKCRNGVNCRYVHEDFYQPERKFLDSAARRNVHNRKNI